MKNPFLFLIVFLTQFVTGWGQEFLLLSLKKAEDLAIRNNYQLNAGLHRLEQGYYGFKASKDYFKPKVNFSSDLNVVKEQHSLDSALKVAQPVFDQVASYHLKEAQIQWELLRLDVQQQICDILYQVREAYFSILLNQAHLVVDQMIIQLWEEEVRRQERLIELGTSIPFELNQAKLHLQGAWIDYYATESDIRSNQITLLTVLGLPPHTVFNLIEKEISLPPFHWQKCHLEQWKLWAFQYCPQLKQRQFSYLLSQNRVCQLKAEKLPTVNLYASAGRRYINEGFDQTHMGVGVHLDWMVYDPSNQQRIKQAKEGSEEAACHYYQVELETEAIIYHLLNELEKSYLSYLAAQRRSSLAEEGVRMAAKKLQLGMMSSFEYRDAIKALREAQQQINQAKFDMRHTYDQLIQQTGLDLEQR